MSVTSAAALAIAAYLSYRILRFAMRSPRPLVLAISGVLLCVPVALMQWAGLPQPVVVAPLLVVVGIIGWRYFATAQDRTSALRGVRIPSSSDRSRGWWEAPEIASRATDSISELANHRGGEARRTPGAGDLPGHRDE